MCTSHAPASLLSALRVAGPLSPLAVSSPSDRLHPQLLPRRAHGDRLRRHGPAGSLHRQQTRSDRPFRGNFEPDVRLTSHCSTARQGCTVVVPYREEMAKRHLKLTGDLGRVVFIVRVLETAEEEPITEPRLGIRPPQHAIDRGERQTFGRRVQPGWPELPHEVSWDGTNWVDGGYADEPKKLLPRGCAYRGYPAHRRGCCKVRRRSVHPRLVVQCEPIIHLRILCHQGSQPPPASRWTRSDSLQGLAEHMVRDIYPETTIVRPAPMFGFEDNLLLKLASVVNMFTANNMQERYWPVHVCGTPPRMRGTHVLTQIAGHRCW